MTVVVLPAPSFATTVMVFEPSFRVISFEKVPSSYTVTALPLIVSVTGLDVASFVVPATVTVVLFVTSLFTGLVTDNSGGTVSILNETLF